MVYKYYSSMRCEEELFLVYRKDKLRIVRCKGEQNGLSQIVKESFGSSNFAVVSQQGGKLVVKAV